MGRRIGPNSKKISAIISILIQNPDGLWIRNIAKKLSYSPTTVSAYVSGTLKPLVEVVSLGEGKPLLKVVRLKPIVLQKLQEGEDINRILKFLFLVEKHK